ncbi:MAG TPA: phosphatase PAP2 family protein, partial [Candidatus Paceibacterota bacterium]|nr:phosphatase PAP2 family protein [Candidatus Paceibacterota bacterium]
VSMGIAKMFVERARPSVLTWLDPSNTYSFPSGHATLSAAFYGFVSVQLYRRSHTRLTRILSLLIPMLLIALISVSRIILNYHYFTDVLAGILLGLFWLAVIFMLPKPRPILRPFAKARR